MEAMSPAMNLLWFTLERVRTVLLALAIIVLFKCVWIIITRLSGAV